MGEYLNILDVNPTLCSFISNFVSYFCTAE